MTASILITGRAGYIGSHTAVALMEAGHRVIIVDNLSNNDSGVLDRLRQLGRIFAQHAVNSVIHFAGLKAIGESIAKPLRYFDNNVCGALSLLQAMERAQVRCLVLSSPATVHGDPEEVPIPETAPLRATNPYGHAKLVCEGILRDLQRADPRWAIALLRYFNPVGAHPSGLIGEAPNGMPNNLVPCIAQVAGGLRDHISIFGDDYPTLDGTGVRDYIHVMDLTQGHLAALDRLAPSPQPITVNLGTGAGISVKQLVDTFARVTGRPVAHRYVARRAGDVAACYANTAFARSMLGWQAEHDIVRMCEDTWRWQSMNPDGYAS